MSDDEHFVIRDSRGNRIGTVESEYKYRSYGPSTFGLGGLIVSVPMIFLAAWLAGGIVLSLLVQIGSKIFGQANLWDSIKWGFWLSIWPGLAAAGWFLHDVLKDEGERKALKSSAINSAIVLGILIVVIWAIF